VAELAGNQPVTLTGDWPGLPELPDAFRVDMARRPSPSAETLALLAQAGLAGADPESCFTLRPAYISPSQAERVKGVNLGL
jgi:tRNA A37 threonylcarbamoyladenosine modification protein TsaB